MKATFLILACCGTLAACALPRATTAEPKPINTAAAVQQRIDQLSHEIARLEPEPPTAETRRSIRRLRDAWTDYLRARREADRVFAQQGITFDSDYYRLQHRLLDAQFAQIRHLHQPQ